MYPTRVPLATLVDLLLLLSHNGFEHRIETLYSETNFRDTANLVQRSGSGSVATRLTCGLF